jgi:hypothetical protein
MATMPRSLKGLYHINLTPSGLDGFDVGAYKLPARLDMALTISEHDLEDFLDPAQTC